MRYAIDSPILGDYSSARTLGELALVAEESGWDGFFIWDHLTLDGTKPIVDPWVALSVMASMTTRIRIGTAVTPIPRRRPWKLARETVSVDHLSGGRLTLGVGLGSPANTEYERFGEEGDIKIRAAKLDEGLDVLTGLWTGKTFSYRGDHFLVDEARFLPSPVQSPRIPIWVGATWPNKAPLRRAARWDGVYPIYWEGSVNAMSPAILKTIIEYIGEYREGGQAFDAVAGGADMDGDRSKLEDNAMAYAEAGATWYAAPIGPQVGNIDEAKAWIQEGQPKA